MRQPGDEHKTFIVGSGRFKTPLTRCDPGTVECSTGGLGGGRRTGTPSTILGGRFGRQHASHFNNGVCSYRVVRPDSRGTFAGVIGVGGIARGLETLHRLVEPNTGGGSAPLQAPAVDRRVACLPFRRPGSSTSVSFAGQGRFHCKLGLPIRGWSFASRPVRSSALWWSRYGPLVGRAGLSSFWSVGPAQQYLASAAVARLDGSRRVAAKASQGGT
jgi:hypothetical protein